MKKNSDAGEGNYDSAVLRESVGGNGNVECALCNQKGNIRFVRRRII